MDTSFTVSVFVRRFFNGYLRGGLMQGDGISQDGNPEHLAGHLPFYPHMPIGMLLSPHANRHVGDISFTLFFVCLQDFGNGYLRRGLV